LSAYPHADFAFYNGNIGNSVAFFEGGKFLAAFQWLHSGDTDFSGVIRREPTWFNAQMSSSLSLGKGDKVSGWYLRDGNVYPTVRRQDGRVILAHAKPVDGKISQWSMTDRNEVKNLKELDVMEHVRLLHATFLRLNGAERCNLTIRGMEGSAQGDSQLKALFPDQTLRAPGNGMGTPWAAIATTAISNPTEEGKFATALGENYLCQLVLVDRPDCRLLVSGRSDFMLASLTRKGDADTTAYREDRRRREQQLRTQTGGDEYDPNDPESVIRQAERIRRRSKGR
jgi:hypothetical protein